MRPVTVEHIVSQFFAEMPTAGVAPSWTPNTPGWYVRLYGNYQPFGHAGMDFKCPIGTQVYAMADGIVLYAGWSDNLPGTGSVRKWLLYAKFPGIVTVIQHPGWIGVYAHLSDNDMAPTGTEVKMGQLIALSGNTGGVTAHLHVEALVDLTYKTGGGLIYGRTDPSKFFNTGLAAQGTITADSIITKLEEAGMALDHEDKVFFQEVVNGANNTAILDNRAQTEHWARQIIGSIKDSNWDIKTFVQGVDNENTDRSIIDNRAEEEKTRLAQEEGK